MIDRFLRRLTVRQRILGGFVLLLFLTSLAIPAFFAARVALTDRLQEVSGFEARAERRLLRASALIASSRVNLMRYVVDYVPSIQDSLSDVDEAVRDLTEAGTLSRSLGQKMAVASVLDKLNEYQTLIKEMQAARLEGRTAEVSAMLFEAYRLGTDIGQRIEQIVAESEVRLEGANQAIYEEDRRRMVLLLAGYAGVLALALILAGLLQRSITHPVTELRGAAEAFQQGRLDTTVPVVGRDELSLLAQTFNQMAEQLSRSYLDLEQRVAERTAALERRSHQLEAATRVARGAAMVRDVDQLLTRTASLIAEQFGSYQASIFLIDEAAGRAVLRAASLEAGRRLVEQGYSLRIGQVGIVAHVAEVGEPRIALDVSQDADYVAHPDFPLARSEMALPLKVREQMIGVLDVQSEEPDAFSVEDVAILQTVADQLALAIENARLLQRSQRTLRELEALYGRQTREAWQKRGARQEVAYRYTGVGVEAVPPHQTLDAGSAQAEERGRQLVAPIQLRGQAFGSIVLRQVAEQSPWTSDEVALIEEVSTQVGLALENARLLEETRRRAEREQLTREITARMRESLDLDTVLQVTARELRQVLDLAEAEVRIGVAAVAGDADDRVGSL